MEGSVYFSLHMFATLGVAAYSRWKINAKKCEFITSDDIDECMALEAHINTMPINYHCSDFNFDEWAKETMTHPLPQLTSETEVENYAHEKWDMFYHHHTTGNFFKPRNYIYQEFGKWFQLLCQQLKYRHILEVGCGHGCTLYPLIQHLPLDVEITATDYSVKALEIFRKHAKWSKNRIRTQHWDVTKQLSPQLNGSAFIILCIFAMSAVHPHYHRDAFQNIYHTMANGGCILFRDYAIHDMTMYRHKTRFDDRLFQRSDGTLSYYFDIDYITDVVISAGFKISELSYACVNNVNHRKSKTMKRVFIHGVFTKPQT